ncbi:MULTISPECIES: saccharopine dehydrogenase NADP-binding domain-containing protein [unclassified Variovorax]|jgi:saccharopine dehydrogenase-like NADP-dependent oxidoreductase|uniref:saccharopine dehydrogenase family protein n=1 Tax=unclassified Variovorax TaxID=663243 RepID=UPI000F7F69A0|nr:MULTISPECIES: saccharopine dehydrogenase NADP-binding domain-containing protein [unclassified Variovorax]RSZ38266.1 saccharopine dehydrogenase [Variovorax sp. 553]RSZ39282.1 saccharopine dehydrogenase [Variovorax sp. 679]
MKTLVLGGYGNFGARISRALAGSPGIELLVAGRGARRATEFAASLGGGATGVRIDVQAADFADTLRGLGVQLVIHTAGPFQNQDYRVPQAVAAAGAHYIDLADGRRFVCDFPAALDAVFREAGRLAVSGASTVPALSSAVVDHLTAGWRGIRSIDICIAPAQGAPRGEATLAGVLAYCGEPIRVWQDGRWGEQPGWADPVKVEFARMKPRRGALCDIPDLELFPARHAGVQSVMFRAALEVGLAQRAFAFMAFMHRIGLLPAPQKLAPLLHFAGGVFDALGTALGGMVVRVEGTDSQGAPARRAWHIAADDNHGPEIPCMAAILLARRLARGDDALPIGANACAGLLDLAEFEPEFARWGMVTDVVEEENPATA